MAVVKWCYLLPSTIRALPELAHLPARDRSRAFEAARRDLGWPRQLVLGVVLGGLVALAATLGLGRAGLVSEGVQYSVSWLWFGLVMIPWRAFSDRATVRHLRRTNRFCETCGYDLRASPDRCPECGTVPAR